MVSYESMSTYIEKSIGDPYVFYMFILVLVVEGIKGKNKVLAK